MRFSPKVGHTQGRELSGKRQKAGPAPSRAQRFLSGKQGDYLSQRKCVQRARPRPIHETSSCSARSGDGAGNHFIYDAKSHAPRRGMTPNPDPNRKIRIPKPNQPPKHCRIRDPNLLQNPRPTPAEFETYPRPPRGLFFLSHLLPRRRYYALSRCAEDTPCRTE